MSLCEKWLMSTLKADEGTLTWDFSTFFSVDSRLFYLFNLKFVDDGRFSDSSHIIYFYYYANEYANYMA